MCRNSKEELANYQVMAAPGAGGQQKVDYSSPQLSGWMESPMKATPQNSHSRQNSSGKMPASPVATPPAVAAAYVPAAQMPEVAAPPVKVITSFDGYYAGAAIGVTIPPKSSKNKNKKKSVADSLALELLSSGDVVKLLKISNLQRFQEQFVSKDINGATLSQIATKGTVEGFHELGISIPKPVAKAFLKEIIAYELDGVPTKYLF